MDRSDALTDGGHCRRDSIPDVGVEEIEDLGPGIVAGGGDGAGGAAEVDRHLADTMETLGDGGRGVARPDGVAGPFVAQVAVGVREGVLIEALDDEVAEDG